jgi:hypothetical protein
VALILPFVKEQASAVLNSAFEKTLRDRKVGSAAREVADLYFFETAVRLHRVGEGAPYTGLKPAGLEEGPVIPVAEKAIKTGSPDESVWMLTDTLEREVRHRFDHMQRAQTTVPKMSQRRARLEVGYQAMKSDPHDAGHEHHHG